MTRKQAGDLVKRLQAAFPRQPEVGADTAAEYVRCLTPLPHAFCERRINLLIMGEGRREKDAPFMPGVQEVLGALEVVGAARSALDDVIRDGWTLERSRRALGGWEPVDPNGPLPRGVAEEILIDGGELPEGRPIGGLPAVGPPEPLERPDSGAHLAQIGQHLRERKVRALRRAFEQIGDPRTREEPVSFDDPRIPPALLQAIEAAEAERRVYVQRAAELQEELRAQRAARRAEVETALVGAPTAAAALELLERLAAQLVADPLVGLGPTVEAFRRGTAPTLRTRLLRPVLAPPSLVDLDGLDGPPEARPLEGLTIVFAAERST